MNQKQEELYRTIHSLMRAAFPDRVGDKMVGFVVFIQDPDPADHTLHMITNCAARDYDLMFRNVADAIEDARKRPPDDLMNTRLS